MSLVPLLYKLRNTPATSPPAISSCVSFIVSSPSNSIIYCFNFFSFESRALFLGPHYVACPEDLAHISGHQQDQVMHF